MRVRGPFDVPSSQHPSTVLASSGPTVVGVAVLKEWGPVSPITHWVCPCPSMTFLNQSGKKPEITLVADGPFPKGVYTKMHMCRHRQSACFRGQCGWVGRTAVASVSSDRRSHWGFLCQLPGYDLFIVPKFLLKKE